MRKGREGKTGGGVAGIMSFLACPALRAEGFGVRALKDGVLVNRESRQGDVGAFGDLWPPILVAVIAVL